MKVETNFFYGLATYATVTLVVYWLVIGHESEGSGVVLLGLVAAFGTMLGVYLHVQQRRVGERPADETSAPERTGEEDRGYFPHASLWPLFIGLGLTLVVNGFIFGTWLIVPGAVLVALAVGGFLTQSRRRALD